MPLVSGQAFGCTTTGELANQIIPRLKQNQALITNQEIVYPRSTSYVPVKFHLVAKNDGSGRLSYSKVLEQLCKINDDFAPLDIQFYIKDNVNFLDNTSIYEDHTTAQNLMNFSREPGALNIFIMEDVNPSNQSARGYYSPSLDWIVIENQEIGGGRSLTHEIGHYFSLLHPFHGWDIEPYNPDVHGIPAPYFSPMGVQTEKSDGSNCSEAGDLLCDTPPDYAYNYPWPDCTFDANILDPDANPIDPDEKLFMNYFDCPRDDYYFSPQQAEVMKTDLVRRSDLKKSAPLQSSVIRV